MRKLSKNSILLLLSGIFFAYAYFIDDNTEFYSPSKEGEKFQKVLHSQESEAENILFELSELAKNHQYSTKLQEHYERFVRNGMSFYIFSNDSLIFWTDNSIPLKNISVDLQTKTKILNTTNGWYVRKSLLEKNISILGLIKIKQEFSFQNDYLKKSFPESFKLNSEVAVSSNKTGDDDILIKSKSGTPLFYLNFSNVKSNKDVSIGGVIFLILSVLLFSLVIVKWYSFIEIRLGRRLLAILVILFLISIRVFSFAFPQDFNAYNLFDPTYYASSNFFPSFGDMLINVVLILLLISLFLKLFPKDPKPLRSKYKVLIAGIFLLSFLFFYGSFITDLFKGIIDNSSINFHLSDLFRLDGFIYFGLLSISLLYLSFFILGNKIIEFLKLSGLGKRGILLLLVILISVYIFINHFYGWVDMIMVLWSAVICLLIFYYQYLEKGNYSFSSIILSLSLFAFLSSHILSKYSSIKEKKSREFLAERFVTDQDPISESLFPEISKKLVEFEFNSEMLKNLSNDTLKIRENIVKQLFSGYWDKYNVEMEIYPNNLETDSIKRLWELEDLVGFEGEGQCSELIYVSDSKLDITYLFRFNVYENLSDDNPGARIFFILRLKEVPEEIGFPVLLMDARSNSLKDLKGYSYARYVDSKLTKNFGGYEFPLEKYKFLKQSKKSKFFDFGTHNHLYYDGGDGNAIVLSKKKEGIFAPLTLFSYLFSFHSIVLLVFLFMKNMNQEIKLSLLNLKAKVQILIAAILLITLVLFAIGTRYFIENEYKEKNYNLISEKIESVLVEVTNKLKGKDKLENKDREYLQKILEKFSGVFFTDISIYNTTGDLLASSRNQMFDGGLMSKKMQPNAFLQLHFNKQSKFIHEEQIGRMQYLSAYVPFINTDGKLLAYLNLPYFARQDELENEIFAFLVSIVNIFVLLFGFSMVSALFITNWITKPLKLLEDNLSRVEFGKSNRTIDYHGNDEIASLVNEYNRKVVELERNSQLLAKSERESAWREMAKQVAHEIKNPLTPMKLSVQHLQRSLGNHDEDWDEKFEKVSKMLIEQIDTLSEIAGEFSDFAKMPVAERKKINIVEVIKSVIELYKEDNVVEVEFINNLKGEEFVYADKSQMGRVLGNLIKNAYQAIPEGRQPEVRIGIKREKAEYVIEIKDNGMGISESEQKKIFSPNFTTKTDGMGLGLAIVKNIIEGSNGKIYFESKVGVGTSFYIKLPEYKIDA